MDHYPSAIIFRGHTDVVTCVCLRVSGDYLASGSLDCTIRVWPLQGVPTPMVLVGHTAPVLSVCFMHKAPYFSLVSTSADGSVRFWDCRSEKSYHVIADVNSIPTSLSYCFDPDCTFIGTELGMVFSVVEIQPNALKDQSVS